MRSVLLLILVAFPCIVDAAVTISEVAWMGNEISANHEWIELQNDGAAVDVTGWTLDDGMSLSIELSGIVPAGSYVVLERTSDATVAGDAFLIYTGSLVNTGATLTLRRADGQIEDRVSGGEDWKNIGGDNVTKETAQYSTSGWFTGPATPGAPGDRTDTPETEEARSVQTESKRSSSKADGAVSLTLPDVSLQLEIVAPKIGYVNQEVAFDVVPTGIGKTLIDSLEYQWNFGDTLSAEGKSVAHRFGFPGTYVVTVHAGFKRQEQIARHEITILPATFSLSMNQAGDVQVNNDSPYEVDISGFRLVGEEVVVFPERSIILPNQTVTVPHERLGATRDRMLALYDDIGSLVTSRIPVVAGVAAPTETAFVSQSVVSSAPFARISAAAVSRSSQIEEDAGGELVATIAPSPVSAQAAAVSGAPSGGYLDDRRSYTLLAVILMLVIFGIYLSPRRNQSE